MIETKRVQDSYKKPIILEMIGLNYDGKNEKVNRNQPITELTISLNSSAVEIY